MFDACTCMYNVFTSCKNYRVLSLVTDVKP